MIIKAGADLSALPNKIRLIDRPPFIFPHAFYHPLFAPQFTPQNAQQNTPKKHLAVWHEISYHLENHPKPQ